MKIIFIASVALAVVADCSTRHQADGVYFRSAAFPVYCTIDMSRRNARTTCIFNQAIDSEEFGLGSPKNTSIQYFDASFNNQMKFLPKHIGRQLPNLKGFWANYGGLTIVRDFYFRNMDKLEILSLHDNQIKKIEAFAFDDLASLTGLFLWNNKIETLDEKIFTNLDKLVVIHLDNNQIKFLSPTTFWIPGNEKLGHVNLKAMFALTLIIFWTQI